MSDAGKPDVAALLLARAREQARCAVLMQAMATLARGETVNPQQVVEKADAAALSVRYEDMTTVTLNREDKP